MAENLLQDDVKFHKILSHYDSCIVDGLNDVCVISALTQWITSNLDHKHQEYVHVTNSTRLLST